MQTWNSMFGIGKPIGFSNNFVAQTLDLVYFNYGKHLELVDNAGIAIYGASQAKRIPYDIYL